MRKLEREERLGGENEKRKAEKGCIRKYWSIAKEEEEEASLECIYARQSIQEAWHGAEYIQVSIACSGNRI